MYISQVSRNLYNKIAQGWNTWDISSVTAHVFLPDKLRVNVAFIAPNMGNYISNIYWEHVESFGEHAVGGSYTEVNIKYLDGLFKVETSAMEDELLIRVTPLKPRQNCLVALEVSSIWGGNVNLNYANDQIMASTNEQKFSIKALNTVLIDKWNPSNTMNILCKADETAYFTVNSSKKAHEIDQTIECMRERWLSETISSEGMLGEGLAALRRSLLWNTIYDFRNSRVITPVSRDWSNPNRCKWTEWNINVFGDYVLFGWDTFFAALQFGLIDKDLAYANMFSILEEITPEGMIANVAAGTGRTRDRSEPQVGALCAWKLYQQFGDKWFIEECFDRLLTWNRWRFENRDCNGDGLLELASVPWNADNDEEIWNIGTCGKCQGAKFESGLDNSTMWDRAIFNEEKHCLELSYVGLNAEMVFDCECLEKMAALLGREEERKELEDRRLPLTKLINENLWNEEVGCYLNKNWSGEFDPCLSLTHFYPITAGIVEGERLETLLDKHLLNEEEFWGEYVIPNISKNDLSYEEQDYWRGRIWAPTNFLVGEGIMRIKRFDIWDELVKKGLHLFTKCWRDRGVVGENYNSITGEAAEDGKASDRFYHWGALLVYMAVERVINFNQWENRMEIYKLPEWLSEINNIPVKDGKIHITKDGSILV
jgi:putative isomerase